MSDFEKEKETSEIGCSWPEQDAVEKWKKKYHIILDQEQEMDLKDNVSKYRIELQQEITLLRAEIERLEREREEIIRSRDMYHDLSSLLQAEIERKDEAITKAIDLIDDRNYGGARFVLSLVENVEQTIKNKGGVMIEPSDIERAELPETSARYIEDLEADIERKDGALVHALSLIKDWRDYSEPDELGYYSEYKRVIKYIEQALQNKEE